MNRKLASTLFATVLMACLLLTASVARADSINFILDQPVVLDNSPGQTISFFGTISAPTTNSADIFLNLDSFNVTSPASVDDSPFFMNFPFFLTPGQSVHDVVFTVTIPADAGYQEYDGYFTVQGGSTGQSFDVTATQEFHVVPEPASMILLSTGLSGLVGVIRRRKR